VIGYPKAGTSWARVIVRLIKNNLDFDDAETFAEPLKIVQLMSKPKLRVLKTHKKLRHMPDNLEKKVKVCKTTRF
jgi:hypothetical protein